MKFFAGFEIFSAKGLDRVLGRRHNVNPSQNAQSKTGSAAFSELFFKNETTDKGGHGVRGCLGLTCGSP